MIRKIVKLVFGLSVAFCASAVLYFGITDKGTPQQEAVAQAATRLTCRPHMAEASDHEWPSPAVVHAAHRCRDAGSPGVSLVRIADWSRASNPDGVGRNRGVERRERAYLLCARQPPHTN
jgi:hypothetical protein